MGITTAKEYRHISEEFFRQAHTAKTEEERKRFFNMAQRQRARMAPKVGARGLGMAGTTVWLGSIFCRKR